MSSYTLCEMLIISPHKRESQAVPHCQDAYKFLLITTTSSEK